MVNGYTRSIRRSIHTVKGKGVSFMEDNPSFHGKAPNDAELKMAMEELDMSAPSTGGASRDGYGAALLNLADDPRVVVIEADLGEIYQILPLP